jgi:hypothetical protein
MRIEYRSYRHLSQVFSGYLYALIRQTEQKLQASEDSGPAHILAEIWKQIRIWSGNENLFQNRTKEAIWSGLKYGF